MDSVIIKEEINNQLSELIQQLNPSQIAVLVDENTFKHCYPLVKPILPKHFIIKIKSGEEHKHLATCEKIWHDMTDKEFDRHALLINLGGGVITDMGGFCAATYKRGIRFINIPTTLLSQVDASVGGKTGVDFNKFKNHIGVFQEPLTVLIGSIFLNTLSERELRSGFAEIIKHCLIADKEKWNAIRVFDLNEHNWLDLIDHSVQIKSAITTEDPTEKGKRKLLNFGHTIGHAMESYLLSIPKRKILHGEAIAAGMICEAYLSVKKKLIKEEVLIQIEEYIYSIYGTIKLDDSDIQQIIPYALQDKKNKDGKIQCVLLNGIGEAHYDYIISKKEIEAALKYYIG